MSEHKLIEEACVNLYWLSAAWHSALQRSADNIALIRKTWRLVALLRAR